MFEIIKFLKFLKLKRKKNCFTFFNRNDLECISDFLLTDNPRIDEEGVIKHNES